MNSNLYPKHCTGEASTLQEIPCKLKSSRYKGVVPQHNGRWGAQIYEHHRRIWLGTFADEVEAAHAYDVAVQRFRGAEATTNFKRLLNPDPDVAAELLFIAAQTKEDIVRMLRNNTYHEELKNSLQKRQLGRDFNAMRSTNNGCVFEFLFHKTVTPSDVGKLNRLVIPKQHAEKHFPIKKDDKISINFQDGEGKVWRFTYSYWYSSQSYVMTRGWKMFVKEKGIKEGDVVSFWSAFDGSGFNQNLIDIIRQPCDQVATFLPTSIDEGYHMHDQETIRLFGVDICKTQPHQHQE